MSKVLKCIVAAYPERGVGNDPEHLDVVFHHLDPMFLIPLHTTTSSLASASFIMMTTNYIHMNIEI